MNDGCLPLRPASAQKRWLTFLLVGALSAAGCGGRTSAVDGTAVTEDSGEADAQVADGVANDTVSVDGFQQDSVNLDGLDTAGVDVPGGCTQDKDCALPTPCVVGQCVAGGCSYTPGTAPCDDGNACTTGDACNQGKCLPGKVTSCEDGDACTVDACELASGCTHTQIDGVCTDGNACTTGDSCLVGLCIGATLACDDANPCTDDSCDAATGCIHVANQNGCSDDNPCTLGDVCAAGKCIAGSKPSCDDGNACTLDTCDVKLGCAHTATEAECTDGNACTTGDACKNGVCTPAAALMCDDANPCTTDACDLATGCTHADANGAACDDGQKCSALDLCFGGTCLGVVADCADSNPCTDDTCTDTAGCVHLANDVTCDDGNACSLNDACANGACAAKADLECDDANPCTKDACDLAIGCTHTVIEGACSDNDACTAGDTCGAGVCQGAPIDCSDGNTCTDDSCNAQNGCQHIGLDAACSDGDACTAGDWCAAGQCAPGATVGCDDGNPCTTDQCEHLVGCTHVAADGECTDGNACTTGDACLAGKCVPTGNLKCDDANPCTTDACAFDVGCVASNADGLPCDDGQKCSAQDACVGGKCLGLLTDCNDNNPCTDDTCVDGTGCVHLANEVTCSDGNVCTLNDACGDSVCKGVALVCNDNNPCTAEGCDPKTGCFSQPANDGLLCTDNSLCSSNDVCVNGSCTGTQIPCAEPDQCHAPGVCDPASGTCSYAIQGYETPCATSNCCSSHGVGCGNASVQACVCTIDSFCCQVMWDGICVNEATDQCGGNVANVGIAAPVGCDDGLGCTDADLCVNGLCLGTPNAATCDDNNACTADSCDGLAGCLHATLDGNACDDGSACTNGDTCVGQACTAGPLVICSAMDDCHTVGTCDPANGVCSNPNAENGIACSDGSACTASDTCADGTCAGGAAPNCDDDSVCTDDACAPATGCVHTAALGECLTTSLTLNNAASTNTAFDGGSQAGTAQTVACPVGSIATGFSGRTGGWWDQVSLNCAVLNVDGTLGATSVAGPFGSSVGGDPITPSNCPSNQMLAEVDVGLFDFGNGQTAVQSLGGRCLTASAIAAKASASSGDSLASVSGTFGGTAAPALICPVGSAVTGVYGYAAAWAYQIGFTCTPLATVCATYAPVACNDGNACTTSDTCASSACVGGAAANCDDANGCTTDNCSTDTGCVHTITSGAICDDGNACSTGETCSALGVCGGGNVCASCSNNVCVGPNACTSGTSGVSSAKWVVCSASATSIWIGHASGSNGNYDAGTICKSLGYNGGVTGYGGTCGTECGYCQGGGPSCSSNGNQTFDGGGNHGPNADGPILGATVMWKCAK